MNFGNFHVDTYCGAKLFRWSDWKLYGLYRRIRTGFSIGPVLFWKETF